MRILYILGAYKPKPSANGICSENIINALKNNGHDVTVLANDVKYEKNDETGIFRVKPRLFISLVELGENYINKMSFIGKLILKIAKIMNKLQLLFMIPFWPSVSLSTIRRFRNRALKLHEQMHFDMVISVYTPIESLLAGFELKRRDPSIIFIPYFLDSLSGGYGPKLFSEEIIRKRGLKIEKKIFKIADKIVLMKSSKNHQIKYNSEYVSKMCFLDIPMLILRHDLQCKKKYGQKIKLLFVGSISYKIRNPQILIDALCVLDRDDIECEFIGRIDCMEHFKILQKKMGERLKFSGFIKHEDLEEKFCSADVLLNIGNSRPTMVPSKIFEYMSYEKAIISTFNIENEPSVNYLSNYPKALLLSGENNPYHNAQLINAFLNNNIYDSIDSKKLIDYYYLNIPDTFVKYVVNQGGNL